MKTRAKPKAPSAVATQTEEAQQLPPVDTNPPQLFIVNGRVGNDATIITLAHPRTLKPTQYYMCPKTGVYEIRRSAVDPNLKRSILLDPKEIQSDQAQSSEGAADKENEAPRSGNFSNAGYVLKEDTTHTITPIDPLFLLLPALRAASSKSDSEPGHFRSSDDILEALFEQSKHLSRLARSPIRPLLELRMAAACDTVEAGDESMYRLREEKLLSQIIAKAQQVTKDGLPPSMEDKFVVRPLEIPLYAQASRATNVLKEIAEDNMIVSEKSESQSTVGSNASNESFESQGSAETSITVPDTTETRRTVPNEVTQLQRLRTAINLILSLYVPEHIASRLRERLESAACGVDFTPLNEHVTFLEKAKADAAAARSIGDFTRKRGFDDDEVAAERAEKKRKKEEEEKRKKASVSRGVRDLKKVNVSGMKKMSDFFTKKQPAK